MTRPIIIDCDPGTDDATALFLALASPELDIRLISAVGGNVGLARTVANASAIVGLTGRHVPVFPGAGRALLAPFSGEVSVHGDDGIGGIVLPPGPPARRMIASDAIRAEIRTTPGITLVGIGPATNLALALATEPALASNIAEIVLMTGAWSEGNATPAAEFNAFNDPEALQILLSLGRPITLATLELTNQALCTPARLETLRKAGQGVCLATLCDIIAAVPHTKRSFYLGHPEHDACAIAWLLAPGLFTTRDIHASVDLAPGSSPNTSRGRTIIDRWDRLKLSPNARLLETIDADGFFALLGARLAGLP